jgi:hypothetical protein
MSIPERSTRKAVVATGLLLLALASTVSAYLPVPVPDDPPGVTAKRAGGGGTTGGPPLAGPQTLKSP